jgi:hypothetical protein
MPGAQLFLSGMKMTFNPYRMIFDKVTDLALLRPDGTRVEIEDGSSNRVACELYSAQMLGAVSSKTYGLLSSRPRTKNGDPRSQTSSRRSSMIGKETRSRRGMRSRPTCSRYPQQNGVAEVPVRYAAARAEKPPCRALSPPDLSGAPAWSRGAALGMGLLILACSSGSSGFAVTFKKRRARRAKQQ